MRVTWSKKEIELLYKLYPTGITYVKIAESFPAKTIKQVQNKINHERLVGRLAGMANKRIRATPQKADIPILKTYKENGVIIRQYRACYAIGVNPQITVKVRK